MPELLLSKEFWLMIVGLVVSILVALVPQLASAKSEIIAAVMVLIGVAIAAFGAERTAAARSSGATQSERLSAKSQSVSAPTVKSPQ